MLRYVAYRVANRLTLAKDKELIIRSSSAAAMALNFADEPSSEQQLQDQRKAQLLKEIDEKTGRGFSDPIEVEKMMQSKETFEDFPDWTPNLVSRISQERVRIYEDKVPTLQALVELNLPLSPPPHPGHGEPKVYSLYREREHAKQVALMVEKAAAPEVVKIQSMDSWDEKQDAVDDLFERIEEELKRKEEILGKHPKFGTWVEEGLEAYLRQLQLVPKENEDKPEEESFPVFMDCFQSELDSESVAEPKILHPLKPHETGQNLGRMIEEWELAAHDTSKRIMLRDCTKRISQELIGSTPCRVLVDGVRGSGKTAALAAVVASARQSGNIVLYLPDGDQFSKNGFYLEPSPGRAGLFDLPVLSERVCRFLLESHKDDMAAMTVGIDTLKEFFSADQLKRTEFNGDEISLIKVLELGTEKTSVAAACYGAAVEVLMNQDEKDFVIVADEFNSYFQPGHYFHMDYDPDVKEYVPYAKITLFKPFIDAMEGGPGMKRGGVIAGISRSKGVSRSVTDNLVQRSLGSAITVVEVPRLSQIETEHMLANYESIGLGKLRLDQGDVVMNQQEVNYLRTVSSGIPQRLMDACII